MPLQKRTKITYILVFLAISSFPFHSLACAHLEDKHLAICGDGICNIKHYVNVKTIGECDDIVFIKEDNRKMEVDKNITGIYEITGLNHKNREVNFYQQSDKTDADSYKKVYSLWKSHESSPLWKILYW